MYKLIDNISYFIKSNKVLFYSVVILITLIISVSVVYFKFIGNEQTIDEASTIGVDYIAPVSTLPVDIKDIYETIKQYKDIPSDISMILNNSIIYVTRVKDDVKDEFYVEYSKSFDCTTIKKNIDDKEPIKILYHFEYDNVDSYIKTLLEYIDTYVFTNKTRVDMSKNEDGSIKLEINK